MKIKQFFKKPHVLSVLILFIIAAIFIVVRVLIPEPAIANPGDIEITVNAEADLGPVEGVDVAIKCSSPDFINIGKTSSSGIITVKNNSGTPSEEQTSGSSDTGGGGGAAPNDLIVQAGCEKNATLFVQLQKDGYVSAEIDSGIYTTEADNNLSLTIQPSVKVIILRNPDRNAINNAVVYGGAKSEYPCAQGSDQAYYCPMLLEEDGGTDDILITADGYSDVSPLSSLDRKIGSDPQSVLTSDKAIFAYVINSISSEGDTPVDLLGSATAVRLGDASGLNDCVLYESVWYCPVVLANSDEALVASVRAEAYVERQYEIADATQRSSHSDPQVTVSLSGVQYAAVVNVKDEANNPLNDASVSLGNDFGVTCSRIGSGIYGCILPVSDSGKELRVTMEGYDSATTAYQNRSNSEDHQLSIDVVLKKSAEVQNDTAEAVSTGPTASDSQATHLRKPKEKTPATTAEVSAPVADDTKALPVDETAIVAESKILAETKPADLPQALGAKTDTMIPKIVKEIVKKVEKILVPEATSKPEPQPSTASAFIEYGTTLTAKLGAGERAGVISSFEKAYGRQPQNEQDWQDVIKIANGRWPSSTSQAVEKEASQTFEKVYLRAPDETNSKEKAAVTIMAYGIRPAKRSLLSEARAIVTFTSVFERLPKSTGDWDIVRGIAYSGAAR